MNAAIGGIIGALIGGIVSIIGSIVGYVFGVKKEYVAIEKKIIELTGDHTALSKEHTNLSSEHTNISQSINFATQTLSKEQAEIKNAVGYLKEQHSIESERKRLLSQKTLDIQKTSEHVSALVDLLQKQSIRIQELSKKVNRLQTENQMLQIKLDNYRTYDEEPEL